jgi:hypothetical protein
MLEVSKNKTAQALCAGLEAPYGTLVLRRLPYLLSMLDRNPYSPTYGCFDRGFWHYRTMTDYAAPVHQEAALTFALIYLQQTPDNPYCGSEELHQGAVAAMRFWCGLQRRDGSFDEFYPGERSFVATAFTSYAISETVRLLGESIDERTRGEVLETLIRAAQWLDRHRDVAVVNHTAGAIAALQNLVLLTGDSKFAAWRETKITDLLARQHEEGWFYEYGGADLGYLSMSVDYLAKDYRHSRDERLGRALHKALEFMAHFVHPDGSYGGEYGSRNVKYLMPHGLEIMAEESTAAGYLLQRLYPVMESGAVVAPHLMDDRYTGFFLNKYTEAWAEYRPREVECEMVEPMPQTRFFSGAGLLVHKSSRLHAVVGLSKHGVIKVYDAAAKKMIYGDTGYFAVFDDSTVATTQWLELGADCEVIECLGGVEVQLKCQMATVNVELPMAKYLIPFRLFLKTLGWWGYLMDRFGDVVKDRMITSRRLLPLYIERRIQLEENSMQITDKLQLRGGARLCKLGRTPDASALHVASSRYYQPNEQKVEGTWRAETECIEALNRGKVVAVATQVQLDGAQIEYAVDTAVGKEDMAA